MTEDSTTFQIITSHATGDTGFSYCWMQLLGTDREAGTAQSQGGVHVMGCQCLQEAVRWVQWMGNGVSLLECGVWYEPQHVWGDRYGIATQL